MECCLAILNSYGGPGDDLSDRDSEDSKISDEEPDGVKDSIQNQEHNERPISSKNEEAFSTMDSTEERVRVEKTDGVKDERDTFERDSKVIQERNGENDGVKEEDILDESREIPVGDVRAYPTGENSATTELNIKL